MKTETITRVLLDQEDVNRLEAVAKEHGLTLLPPNCMNTCGYLGGEEKLAIHMCVEHCTIPQWVAERHLGTSQRAQKPVTETVWEVVVNHLVTTGEWQLDEGYVILWLEW